MSLAAHAALNIPQRMNMLAHAAGRHDLQALARAFGAAPVAPNLVIRAMEYCARHAWKEGMEAAWRIHPSSAGLASAWGGLAASLPLDHPALTWLASTCQGGSRGVAQLAGLAYAGRREEPDLWNRMLDGAAGLPGPGSSRLLTRLLEQLACWPNPSATPRRPAPRWLLTQGVGDLLERGVRPVGSVWFTAAALGAAGRQFVWNLLLQHAARVTTARTRAALVALAPFMNLPEEQLDQMTQAFLRAGFPLVCRLGWGGQPHPDAPVRHRLAEVLGMDSADISAGMRFFRLGSLEDTMDEDGTLDVARGWGLAGRGGRARENMARFTQHALQARLQDQAGQAPRLRM